MILIQFTLDFFELYLEGFRIMSKKEFEKSKETFLKGDTCRYFVYDDEHFDAGEIDEKIGKEKFLKNYKILSDDIDFINQISKTFELNENDEFGLFLNPIDLVE